MVSRGYAFGATIGSAARPDVHLHMPRQRRELAGHEVDVLGSIASACSRTVASVMPRRFRITPVSGARQGSTLLLG